MKLKKFVKLIIIEAFKIAFIYFLWALLPALNNSCISAIAFHCINFFLWSAVLFCLYKELKNKRNLKGVKQITLWILFIFLTLILLLPVLRIIDIFKPIHPIIKPLVFWSFYFITFITIIALLEIKMKKVVSVKENDSIQQVIEFNKKIRNYPDEGIFYDSFGCGIMALMMNSILITLCFAFAVFQLIFSIPKKLTCIPFENTLDCYAVLIAAVLFLLYSCSLFLNMNSHKRFRRQGITIFLFLINLFFDLILYLGSKLYLLAFSFQIAGSLIFIFVKLAERFFQVRYGTLKSKKNAVEKLEICNHTKLQDFLKYGEVPSFKCICGDRQLVSDFIDSAYELQLEMMKCGQIFEERKEYYDFIIRINICAYDTALEVCEDIKRKMKEYFNLKYGLIIGKKYIAELISRIKGISFLSGIIQKDDVSFFDKDCSRINVVLDNYHGYYKNNDWTRKLCIFASKLNITITFVSEKEVEEPNESFIIEKVYI